MKPRLELLHRRPAHGGAAAQLCSPAVGLFTRALPAGSALVPGAGAGVLLVLGRAHELVVPAGAEGRVTSAPPALVLQPVGYGDPLYELADLAAGAEGAAPGAAAARGPVLRAPYGGRFFSRPSPSDPPFVAAGDALEPGRTVGLIEVMKTFTEVRYEAGGGLPARARVLRVAAGDGSEVLAGDVLLEVAPA